MINLLKLLMAEQEQELKRVADTVCRQVQFPDIKNKIEVAIGMRRAGKTTFMLQQITKLLAQSIPAHRILYINFEDDRLLPCSQEKLRDLLEGFYTLYPNNHDHLCYLFLDEIHNVDDWPLVIRRFFDTKNVKIYLSGSSAKLLSTEIATSLRGRAFTIEIWPYSFSEFLHARNVQLHGDHLGQQNLDILFHELLHYLNHGGFPESVDEQLSQGRQILQSYVELVIIRDIIERYHIKNIALLKYLIKTLLKNTACGFSVNKFHNDLKSQKIEGSPAVIHNYLSYLEDAYLAFPVLLFDESLRRVQSNPRKIYAVDSGLVKAFTFSLNNNHGHMFENLIYLDLRRQGHEIYYYLTSDRFEVDFLTRDRLGKAHAYQVVWDDKDIEVMNREQRALNALEKEMNIKGQIITPKIYLEKIWHSLKTGDLCYL